MCCEIFEIRGESLIQESLRPPVAGHQVTEPEVTEFVRVYPRYRLLLTVGTVLAIPQQKHFPEKKQLKDYNAQGIITKLVFEAEMFKNFQAC